MENFTSHINNLISDKIVAPILPSEQTLAMSEKRLNFKFGPELREYLQDFGFILFSGVELMGINERQKERSDLIKTTEFLREDYSCMNSYVVIENVGDSLYVVCDTNDRMYEFIIGTDSTPQPMNIDLHQYICKRYNDKNK
jgi:hypothetical protein